MILRKIKKALFVICISLPVLLNANVIPQISNSDHLIIKEYSRIHKQFFKRFCSYKVDHKVDILYRKFLGNGLFIPIINDKELDKKTIKEHLPLIDQKIQWQESLIIQLKKRKRLPRVKKLLKRIDKLVEKLLLLKRAHFYSGSESEKKEYELKSKSGRGNLKKSIDQLINKIPFLLSFTHPVDFFHLREQYENVKDKESLRSKYLANSIYFKRKILEDGSVDYKTNSRDIYLRSLLSTIFKRLETDQLFLSEEMRYDIESISKWISKIFRTGRKRLLLRLVKWHKKTKLQKKFYSRLAKFSDKSVEDKSITDLVNKKVLSRYQLKDFILYKNASVYKFWSKKKEIHRALFALETILFNEVGDLDGRLGLDRMDIIQVVINRRTIPFFSTIQDNEDLRPYLNKENLVAIGRQNWLNVLFKKGEFSFTYFFIRASKKIFCPDMTRKGRFLRKENLRFTLKALRNPRWQYKALRYFSRASMVGRIDMTKIWSDYDFLREAPGKKIRRIRNLMKIIKRGAFKYLYSFKDIDKKTYDVLEIKKKKYVVKTNVSGKLQSNVYSYRNPHYFRFFINKKILK